jgi:hypothetical protein
MGKLGHDVGQLKKPKRERRNQKPMRHKRNTKKR